MKTRLSAIAITAAAVLTLSGCITGTDRTGAENAAYAETKLTANEKARYEAARKQWESNDLSDYFYDADYDCFCYPSGQLQVRVWNNRVVGASNPDCETAVAVEDLRDLHTLDGLFDLIKIHLANPDYRVQVTYHPGLGYPKEISLFHKDETLLDANVHIVVHEIQIPVSP